MSVGLPVYNGGRYLREALDSLLAQTVTDFEIVICDNASTDDTPSICREYAARDARIRYYRSEENIGLARNFNRAFHLARGEYFRWHAHDDVCAPTFLDECLRALERCPEAALASPRVVVIDELGARLPAPAWAVEHQQYADGVEARFKRFARPGRVSSIGIFIFGLYRREALRQTRLMMSHQWADETLLAETLLAGPMLLVPEALLHLRVFPGHATSVMADRDLRQWQRILDPSEAGGWRYWRARYRRYPEYLVSVWRSRLPLAARLRLSVWSATFPVSRLLEPRAAASPPPAPTPTPPRG